MHVKQKNVGTTSVFGECRTEIENIAQSTPDIHRS